MITEQNNFNYISLTNYISQISSRFSFAEVSVIAKTWCKRDIFSLSLGSGKKSVLFLGGMSGTDYITPALLLRFFERLCISYKNDLKISAVKTSSILKEQKITVIPLVNPDGTEISLNGTSCAGAFYGLVNKALNNESHSVWKSNARGVSPDLNFDFNFPESELHNKPCTFGNYGPTAESEKETRAITEFMDSADIKFAVLLSANGEKIIYSPNQENSENALMAQIFKSISGFDTEMRSKEACTGNFCEWFSHKYNRPSFEFSFNNLGKADIEEFDKTYHKNEELLMLSAIL